MAVQPTYHWQFAEREGSIAKDTISGVEGRFHSVLWQFHGRIGHAIRVRGKEGHVNFGNVAGQFGTSDFTIAFGINILNTHDQNDVDIIGNRSVMGHGNWVSLRLEEKQRLTFAVDEDSKGKHHAVAKTGKVLIAEKWQHIAVVREGPTLRIYVNGSLVAEGASETGVANIQNGVDLKLGHWRRHAHTALYEDLRIYHTALNAVQIENLIPPVNRLLRRGQIELVGIGGAAVILTQDVADLSPYSPNFQRLRLGPDTGATLYKGTNFGGVSQKLYADVPEIRFTKLDAFPRSVHIWSTVGDPFRGNWIIKAPNGQNLSHNIHRLTTSPNHTDAELFIFHYNPNFDQPLLMPVTSQEISQLRVGNEATVLVVDDSEPDKDAFSIVHPSRDRWLKLNRDNRFSRRRRFSRRFSWTLQREERAIFHRVIKIADNEGQVGELKAGEVALYDRIAYKGKTWIFSDNEHNNAGNFTSLRSFDRMDNKVSSIRVGPDTGVTLFANENQVVDEARRESEIEDFIDNVPTMEETQIGNDNISSLKIFRTAATETIFTSVTSKLSQDYRMVDEQLEEFSSYRTTLRLPPEVREVEVSATDLTTIEVEGTLHEIDEVRSVTLSPNLLNSIMITSEADDLSTPGLKFRTSDMPENQFVVIFPDQDAHQKIAELEDDALWNATDAQGNLIVDQTKHTQSEVASVQNTIKRVMATTLPTDDTPATGTDVFERNGLRRSVSKSRVVGSKQTQTSQVVSGAALGNPWTLHFKSSSTGTIPEGSAGLVQASPKIWEEPLDQNSFEKLVARAQIDTEPGTISSTDDLKPEFAARSLIGGFGDFVGGVIDDVGDFFDDVGDGIEEGIDFTIGAIDDTINVFIQVGGQIFRFVADTAKKVADFVTAVVEQVVETIQQFIEFLRFLFDWKDILDTQRYLVKTINGAFDSAIHLVDSAKDVVSDFVDTLQDGIEDGINSLIGDMGVEPDSVQTNSGLPEGLEWLLNKILGGSKSKDANTSTAISSTGATLSDGTPFEQALQNLLDALENVVGIGSRIIDGFTDTIESLIANPSRPELALVEILETFRDVGIQTLDFAEDIAFAILNAVIAAIDLLRDILNAEIRIPLISDLFKLLGAGKLTLLNLTTLLVAVPLTAVSKLAFGEAPFKNVPPAEFPQQEDPSVQSIDTIRLQSITAQTNEDELDIDRTRRKVRAFGNLAIVCDMINGLLALGLDAIPEISDDNGESTGLLEVISITLGVLSWLSSFPASPIEPGGYPYHIAQSKHAVKNGATNEERDSLKWERIMWGWRTGVLGIEIIYLFGGFATGGDAFKKQRLRRADAVTSGLLFVFAAVDLGITGRFLATIPKEDGRTLQITNEVLTMAPSLFSWLRQFKDPATLAFTLPALGLMNLVATFTPFFVGTRLLSADLDELR
ncbi:MAG: LamG domain-containing protein [Chloroflexota bacterium]